MTRPLLDSNIADRRVRVVASERTDGDVHPGQVGAPELRSRQELVTSTGRSWSMIDQVHGVDVILIDGLETWSPTLGTGDVIVTHATDVPIAIWAADCAPIVLAADDGALVAAHGGWRGLAAGVVEVAVAAVTSGGASIVAAVLGPVIHPCCYRFGDAELASIPDAVEGRTTDGAVALDVPATVTRMLGRHGVGLSVIGPCTGCDDRWFSHRVRAEPGRHAVVAWWEEAA